MNQYREGYRMESVLITAPNVLEPHVLQQVGKTRATVDCTPCCAESAGNSFLNFAKIRRWFSAIAYTASEETVKELPDIRKNSGYRSVVLQAL